MAVRVFRSSNQTVISAFSLTSRMLSLLSYPGQAIVHGTSFRYWFWSVYEMVVTYSAPELIVGSVFVSASVYGGVRSIGSPATAFDTRKVTLNTVSVVLTLPVYAIRLPRGSSELWASARPAYTVSLLRSDEKIPVESTVNAKTEATTTNAIKMIAVSSPVMPFCGPVLIFNFRLPFDQCGPRIPPRGSLPRLHHRRLRARLRPSWVSVACNAVVEEWVRPTSVCAPTPTDMHMRNRSASSLEVTGLSNGGESDGKVSTGHSSHLWERSFGCNRVGHLDGLCCRPRLVETCADETWSQSSQEMVSKEAEEKNAEGLRLLDAGRHQEALSAFTAAIDAQPDFAAAYRNRSEAYRRQGLVGMAAIDSKRADSVERTEAIDEQERQPVRRSEAEVEVKVDATSRFQVDSVAPHGATTERKDHEPTESEVRQYDANVAAAERTARRAAGQNDLLWGAVWGGGGAVVTGFTYAAGGGGGGFVFWGAILYGGFRILRGLYRLAAS